MGISSLLKFLIGSCAKKTPIKNTAINTINFFIVCFYQMYNNMIFNYKYFLTTIFLFLAEVSIATIFKDIIWLRAYFGDVLVVILIYTFMLTFLDIKNKMLLNIGFLICLRHRIRSIFSFCRIIWLSRQYNCHDYSRKFFFLD